VIRFIAVLISTCGGSICGGLLGEILYNENKMGTAGGPIISLLINTLGCRLLLLLLGTVVVDTVVLFDLCSCTGFR
jgi:hypothetical protein